MRRAAGLVMVIGPLVALLAWGWHLFDWREILRELFIAGMFSASVLYGIALLLPDDE